MRVDHGQTIQTLGLSNMIVDYSGLGVLAKVACTKPSVSVCFVSGGRLVNTFVSYT